MEVRDKLKIRVRSYLGEILDSKGLRFKWVAEQIGCTPSQLSNWCKNEDGYAKSTPSVAYILRLEELLNVRVGEMFKEE